MKKLLDIYSRDKNLEALPYVTGYCGEFNTKIQQQAGYLPRAGGMSFS